ncbi:MAG: Wzz/FepE/Etk N-terminal domain-containing protein, partial [Bacteroidota bacterium]
MSQNQQEYVIQNDEITLKDLILKFQEYFLEILRNWWVIGIAMVIMAAIMYIRARLTPPSYTSQVTFMVSGGGGQNAAANPVASLLGQLGGGGGAGGGANPFKVMQLSKSRKILSKVLFHSVEVMGKEDYIANHLIEHYDYRE